jgi:hypothetical protein
MIFVNVHDNRYTLRFGGAERLRFAKLGFIRMPELMVATDAGAGYWACFEQNADEPVFRPAI